MGKGVRVYYNLVAHQVKGGDDRTRELEKRIITDNWRDHGEKDLSLGFINPFIGPFISGPGIFPTQG
jgi:hypothetical protein